MTHTVKQHPFLPWVIHVNNGEPLTQEQIIERDRKEEMKFADALQVVLDALRTQDAVKRLCFNRIADAVFNSLPESMDQDSAGLVASNAALSFINNITQTKG